MNAALITTSTELADRIAEKLSHYDCSSVTVNPNDLADVSQAVSRADIVLLDRKTSNLPDTRIDELIRQIRRNTDSAWILVLGSGEHEEDIAELLRAGADDYLVDSGVDECLETRLEVATLQVERRDSTETNDRLRAILDGMVDGMVIADISTRELLHVNAAITRMLGYTERELLSMTAESLHPPEFHAEIAAKFVEAATHESPEGLRVPCLHKDGTQRNVHITGGHIVYQGRPCLLGFFRDETEHRQTVRALADSDARFRAVFDHAALGIVVTDFSGRIVETNEQMAAMLGYTIEEILERNVRAMTHPDDLDAETRHFAPLTTGDRVTTQVEKRYLHKDGHSIWARVNASMIPGSETESGYLVGVVEDITAWKQAETSLKEQQDRNRLILENSLDGISVFDIEGNFVDANPAHCQSTGYSREEVLTMNVLDLEVDVSQEDFLKKLRGITERGWSRFETQRRCKHGLPVDIEASVCHSRIGDQEFFFSFSRDVTARKKAEDALRDSESKLRNIFNHMPDCLFTVDRSGHVTFANRVPCGHELEEYLGTHWASCVAPEHLAMVGEIFEQAFETMEADTFVFRSLLDAWFECRVVPLSSDKVREAGLMILTDITKRKVALDHLRQSEHRYRLIAENVSDVIWTARFDNIHAPPKDLQDTTLYAYAERLLANWRFTFVSPSVQRLLGYEPAEAMAIRPEEFFTAESYERIKHALVAKIQRESGPPAPQAPDASLQVEHVTKEGTSRWTEATTHLFRNADNRIVGILGVSRDISQRREAEAALRRSEATFRGLVGNMPDMVIVLDADGVIQFANHPVRDMTVDQLIGTSVVDHIMPEFHEEFQRSLTQALETAEVRSLEVVDRFGTQWAVHMVPMHEEGQNPTVMAISTDVTESRMAEEALLREQDLLRQLLELHENDRQVLAFELHDGFAQQLAGAKMTFDGAARFIDTAPDRAKELFSRGSSLLHESIQESRRLVSGLRPPVLDEFGIVSAIEHMITTYDDEAYPEITFASIGHVDRMAAPLENAIYRIVQESLTNACRHSRSDQVHIELSTHEETIQVVISDNGVGFDPNQVVEGSFGLRGIRERTRLLGGLAEIETQPGAGVTIRVSVPLIRRVENGESPPSRPF